MPNKGFRHSKKTRKQMSESHKGLPSPMKGRTFSEEHKKNLSRSIQEWFNNNTQPTKGKHLSEEHKHRLSLALKGRTFTTKHRANISKSRQNLSPQALANIKEGNRRRWIEYWKTHEKKIRPTKGYSQVKKGDKLPKEWVKNIIAGQLKYYKTHSTVNKGIPHSQATKDKIRTSCLRSGVGKWNAGRVPWNKKKES